MKPFSRVLLLAGLLVAIAVVTGLVTGYAITSRQPVAGTPSGTPATGTPVTPAARTDAPFYFATMTHMEGNFKDDTDQDLFKMHVAQIRYAIALFDEYGAKLTLESGHSFAVANTTWKTNIMKEVVDHGHGVGSHADFGAEREPTSLAALTEEFADIKALVDELVGPENNRGVSGGQGQNDWVTAASNAGFGYMDGVVGFAYLSMPLRERPDGWTDAAIRATYYHDGAPESLATRTHPFWLADASDFREDADGTLLINGGDAGELASLAEGRSNCHPDCVLTTADVDALKVMLDDALAAHDGSRVGKLNIHIPLTLLQKKNDAVLRTMLAMLKTYADDGKILFGTQKDVYDAVSM